MKVLMKSKFKYIGMENGLYKFEDKFGDFTLHREAKLIDRENNFVWLFLESNEDAENIQYSFSTAKRLGVNLDNLRISNLDIVTN